MATGWLAATLPDSAWVLLRGKPMLATGSRMWPFSWSGSAAADPSLEVGCGRKGALRKPAPHEKCTCHTYSCGWSYEWGVATVSLPADLRVSHCTGLQPRLLVACSGRW